MCFSPENVFCVSLQVQPHHFKEGTLKIKCVAMIAKIYYRTNEISAMGDFIHPPPLESRGPGLKPGKRGNFYFLRRCIYHYKEYLMHVTCIFST